MFYSQLKHIKYLINNNYIRIVHNRNIVRSVMVNCCIRNNYLIIIIIKVKLFTCVLIFSINPIGLLTATVKHVCSKSDMNVLTPKTNA